MFYQDHEKTIYRPVSFPGLAYDPLAVDRALVLAAGGGERLNGLLASWTAVRDDVGDISEGSNLSAELDAKTAEEELVRIGRVAFGLPAFPDRLDGEVLEILCDYLEWMEKKGQRGETPQTSPPLMGTLTR